MDTDQLITEAEVFSPPKLDQSEKREIEVEELTMIPHGLSHKHAVNRSPLNRRNSTSAIREPLANLNTSSSPTMYKDTYTCPRKTVGKQIIGLNKLKANLDSKLKTVDLDSKPEIEDKENVFLTPSKVPVNQRQSLLFNTPSLKRRSSEVNSSAKKLKANESVLITPLRPTEPVAASPSNEQNSRIVDNSHLLLDTAKSPNVSSALTSPLANLSHINPANVDRTSEEIEGIDAQMMLAEESLHEDIKDVSAVAANSSFNHSVANGSKKLVLEPLQFDLNEAEEESDFEPTIMASPMSKPTFTVRQLEELQKDHSTEVNDLELVIKEKNSVIDALTQSLNQANKDLQDSNNQLTSYKVEKNKLVESNKILTMRVSSSEELSRKLNKQLRQKDHQISQMSDKNIEFQDQLEQVQENVVSLEANLEVEQENNKELNTKISTMDNTISNLRVNLKEKTVEAESLMASKQELHTKIEEQQIQIKSFDEELKSKVDELKDLNEFKDDLETAIENCNTKISEYEEKVSALMEELEVLSQDYKLKKLESEEQQQEINELHDSLETKMKELDVVFDQKEELSSLSERTKQELEEEKQVSTQLYKQLEEEKQVIESKQEEIIKLQKLNEELNNLVTEHEEKLIESEQKCSEAEDQITSLKQELESVSKDDSDLINTLQNDLKKTKADLEQANETLKNSINERQQLSLDLDSSRSDTVELQKEIASLQKDLKDQELSHEQKLQDWAQDLYVQYSKKHEQKVSILKKGYETKWSNKFKELESENSSLSREIESLKKQVASERDEKTQLIKLWDQFVDMESSKKLV